MNQLTESLWGDEAFSAMAVQQPFWETMGIVMRDTAPPLFYIIGFVWGHIFGFSEVALRSLSLLLMLGSGVWAGLIVYELQKDKLVAVLTGLLVIMCPFLTPFAFEWRMYALLTFTVTGSVYFFVAKKWVGYVILTVMALYTHHFALFTLLAQGGCFLVKGEGLGRGGVGGFFRCWWPFLLVGFLYLPWLYPMYWQTIRVKGGGFWLSVPSWGEGINLLYRFVTGGVVERWRGAVAGAVGLLLLGKNWQRVGKEWLGLVIIFLAPAILAFGLSYLVTPIFYDRYLLSVAVGTIILTGLGTRRWLRPGLLLLVALYGYFSWQQFTQPTKRPFRELAAYVKTEKREGDYLVNINGQAHHLWESKYYGIPAPIYTPKGPLPLYVGTAQMKEEDTIGSLPKVEGRLGAITSEAVESVSLPGYRREEDKQFGDLAIIWFKNY